MIRIRTETNADPQNWFKPEKALQSYKIDIEQNTPAATSPLPLLGN